MTATALYRHWNSDGELLYVGISLSAVQRLGQHRTTAHWFGQIANMTIEWFDSREAALEAERQAIKSECPKFNKAHNAANDNGPVIDEVVVDGHGVYLVRTIETGLFQGIFWAESKADLWDTFDEFGDPFGHEFARLEAPGALCAPGAGVEVRQWSDAEDDEAEDISWAGFEMSESLIEAAYRLDDLSWQPFCAADEDYGMLARIFESAAA